MATERRLDVQSRDAWQAACLEDLASVRTEKIVPTTDDTRPYIGLEHIAQGRPKLLGIGRAGDVISHKTVFRAGDILYGKLRPAPRKVVRVDFDGVCSTDILAIRPKIETDGAYLQHLLHSDGVLVHALKSAEGTKMPRASWDDLRRYAFPCPPPDRREAIGMTLSSIDDCIDATVAMVIAAEHLRKAVAEILLNGRERYDLW